jgi:hypothetical protein
MADPTPLINNPVPPPVEVQAPPVTSGPTLRQRIELAIGQLVVLRATTVVGSISASGADELNQVTGLKIDPENQQVAATSFNMLLGDGSVIVSPIFVTDPAYKALHEKTVEDAQRIREQTVQLLKDMWDKFAPLLDKRLDNKPGS